MDVSEAIKTKRAVRAYAQRAIPDDVARAILHAGRRAQSAMNDQPWHFIAVRERANLEKLERAGPYIDFVARSAMTVAILTPPPSETETILFDAGQAAAYMQLRAWELGVVSCLGSIYEQEPARSLLGFPAELYLRIVIAFGYPQSAATSPPRKGGRRPLADVAHWEHWSG